MNIQDLVEKCKYKSNRSQRSILLNDIIEKNPIVKNIIFDQKKAKSINEIYNDNHFYRYIEDSSIIKEIEWSIEIIKYHSEVINKFQIYKKKYQQNIFQGDLIKARAQIKNINEMSFSLWGLEQEFLISDLEGGFKNNKVFLSKIGNSTNNSLVLMISQFLSSKKSFSVDYKSYNNLIDNHSKQLKDKILKEYFKYKLSTKELNLSLEDLKKILFVENLMTIFDIYETLIFFFAYILSYNLSNSSLHKSNILDYSATLLHYIDDPRIKHILFLNNQDYNNQFAIDEENDSFLELLDLYSQGRYTECIDYIKDISDNIHFNFDIIEIYVKCLTYLGEEDQLEIIKSDVIRNNLVVPMYNIVSCSNTNENIKILENTKKNFINTLFYGHLDYFISRYDQNLKKTCIREISIYFTSVLNPKCIISIKSKSLRNKVLDKLYKENECTTYFIFKSYIEKNNEYLERCNIPYQLKKYLSARLEKNSDIKEALLHEILIERNEYTQNLYFYSKVITCLYYAYMDHKKKVSCIKLIVDSFITNNDLISRMVLDDNELIDSNFFKLSIDDLYKAIYIYILNKNDYSNIYIALANFLDCYNVSKASELFLMDEFQIDKKIEFAFFKLYSSEVMKRIVFILPNQRNQERMILLSKLKTTGYRGTEEYDREIEQILKDESIKNRIIQVEQTKIFVDTKSLIKENELFYKQSFQNFITLDNPDLDYADINHLESDVEILTKKIEKIIRSEKVSQKYLVFKEIYSNFLMGFLFDYKFGLEKFLSSRIRHGHLENNLLRSIKNYNLLSESTKIDPNNYTENTYWFNQLNGYDTNIKNQVFSYLSDFSIKIIEKVKEVKEWLSVNDENHPNGLFDYSNYFSEEVIKAFFVTYQESIDYTIFFDDLINLVWAITNQILDEIKEKIENELFPFFYSSLNSLHENVDKNIDNCDFKMIFLSQVNLCKSNIKSDIDIVTNWLNVRTSNDFLDFYFFDAVDACITMQKKLDSSISDVMVKKVNEADLKLNGEYFNYFFDLINILLSNALIHSGFKKKKLMEIEIKASVISWQNAYEFVQKMSSSVARDWKRLTNEESSIPLIIEVKNKLNKYVDLSYIHIKLNNILQRLKNIDVSKEFIFKEGNSGIIKINSILKYNILSPCYNIFYEIDDSHHIITATIVIDINKIVRKDIDE